MDKTAFAARVLSPPPRTPPRLFPCATSQAVEASAPNDLKYDAPTPPWPGAPSPPRWRPASSPAWPTGPSPRRQRWANTDVEHEKEQEHEQSTDASAVGDTTPRRSKQQIARAEPSAEPSDDYGDDEGEDDMAASTAQRRPATAPTPASVASLSPIAARKFTTRWATSPEQRFPPPYGSIVSPRRQLPSGERRDVLGVYHSNFTRPVTAREALRAYKTISRPIELAKVRHIYVTSAISIRRKGQ